jgi:2-polyprenyl-3-methyl-5-hydroxy-6-metoxy-1,4-benzoquinol methylase
VTKVEIHVFTNESEAWDILWKWLWFTRDIWESKYWKEEQIALKPVFPLLSQLKIKSILDCSCGLGYKTILFAKAGYEVEGSDASAIAIKYAPQLARKEKVSIRFFRSRYEELNEKCGRRYDCVWSDNFDEISTHEY